VNSRKTAIAGIVLTIAVLTAVVAGSAFAASPTDESGAVPPAGGAESTPPTPPGPQKDGLDKPDEKSPALADLILTQDEAQEAMSTVLGMTTTGLQDALKEQTLAEIAKEKGVQMADIVLALETVRETTLRTAVEDGTLTQEQADLLASKLEESPAWSSRYDRMFEDGKISLDTALKIAQTLGMTVEDLQVALEQKTFFEIAKEQNVAIADIQSAIEKAERAARASAFAEKLQQAVENGRMTQEQADLMGALYALRGDDFHAGALGMGMFGDSEQTRMPGFDPRQPMGDRSGESDAPQGGPRGQMSDRGGEFDGPQGGPRGQMSERSGAFDGPQGGPRGQMNVRGGQSDGPQGGPRGQMSDRGGEFDGPQGGPRGQMNVRGGQSDGPQGGPRGQMSDRGSESDGPQGGPRGRMSHRGGEFDGPQGGPRGQMSNRGGEFDGPQGGLRGQMSNRGGEFDGPQGGLRGQMSDRGGEFDGPQGGPRGQMSNRGGEFDGPQGGPQDSEDGSANVPGMAGAPQGPAQPTAWPFFGANRGDTN